MTRTRRILAAVVALAAATAGPGSVRAADGPGGSPSPEARRYEAMARFDRAMILLRLGNDAGALAELQQVLEIAPHPLVLYNLGLVHATLHHPVEAARALAQVLQTPGTLPADRLALARRTHDEQVRRIARLDVTTNVPAIIDVDGVAIGTTPLAAPVAVAAGRHVVGAVATGHLPLRREVTVAGEMTAAVAFELTPSEARLAHLEIRSPLRGADVFIDGQRVGQTPLPASLAVAPGQRQIELRRAGYLPASREVTLDDGATGALDFDLEEDDGAAARRGRLVLSISEPDPVVVVDGERRGPYRGPLALPPGLHEVRVLRVGFHPATRLVVVPEGGEATAQVTLEPTTETRLTYGRGVDRHQTWGQLATIGGAGLFVLGGALFAVNRGRLNDAQADINTIRDNEPCKSAFANGTEDECNAIAAPADDRYNTYKTIQNVSLIMGGVGLAAAAVGVVLLLTSDDPDRYKRPPRDERDQLHLTGWVHPNSGGLAVAGGF